MNGEDGRSFVRRWGRGLALAAMVAGACGAAEAALEAGGVPQPKEGTRHMAAELRRLARENQVPENPYANTLRAARFGELAAQAEGAGEEIALRFKQGQELLWAGEEEAAAAVLLEVFSVLYQNRSVVDRESLLDAWKALGISYLRKAEVDNCLLNHSPEACILPFAGGGIHVQEEGSRAAIEIYEGLLRQFPDDLETRYLLNVAYMTLGEHPQRVPANQLIPERAFASEYDLPRFPNRADALGVAVNELSGGVVMDDLNGDGYLDLFVSSFDLRHPLKCFLNDGQGGFVDHTQETGLRGLGGGLNLEHADYDSDGDYDILVLRGGWEKGFGRLPNSLLRNDGRGRFSDVTREAGLYSRYPTQTAAWGDFNNDGWVDLFIGNESLMQRNSQTGRTTTENHPCELYLNNGDGTFEEVAQSHGLDVKAYVKGVVWGDYDRDGRLDLFLSNAQGENYLFRNLGPDATGKWRFEDRAAAAGVARPYESFPTWFWDYDNDGWLDLFVSGYSASRLESGAVARDAAIEYLGLSREAERLWLYRNNGDGTFSDVTVEQSLDHVAYTMGCNFGDLDGDGFLDFYLGTGEPDLRAIVPNRMFRNDAGRGFQDVTTAGGFGHLQKGHGVAFGDLDNDGDQDIYTVLGGVQESDTFGNALFENPGFDNRWIVIRLQGVRSARDAAGALIEVEVATPAGPRRLYRTVGTGGSFGSDPYRQYIGLGDAEAVEAVRIWWPGQTEPLAYHSLSAGKAWLVREDSPLAQPIPYPRQPFKAGPGHSHH